MNIIITNIWLDGHAGTEVYVRDLACSLHLQGIHVEVYAPLLGKVAQEIRAAGILVVDSTKALVEKPDLIHAHHFIPTMEVILRFPDTPLIYFLHDRTFLIDSPPKYPRILKYMAVDYNCLDRLIIDNGIPKEKTGVLYNWVDTSRFELRKQFAARPRKALVFSNYASKDNYFKSVQEACQTADIELDGIGTGFGNAIKDPEKILGQYDIVFAKAKAAMEAMASGAAVILCDFNGLGEMVSKTNFDHFRRFNFGMKTLNRPIEPESILAEIAKYDPKKCKQTALEIREKASFDVYQKEIVKLYQETIANDTHEPISLDRLYGRIAVDYQGLKQHLYQDKIKALKHEQNIQLTQLKAEKDAHIQKLSTQLTQLKAKTEEHLKQKEAHIQGITGSRSYKIGRILTYPLRLIKNRVKP